MIKNQSKVRNNSVACVRQAQIVIVTGAEESRSWRSGSLVINPHQKVVVNCKLRI